MIKSADRLRKPRANPEIKFLLGLIRDKTRELLREKDHAVRKGLAQVLAAHLEELAAEPEFLADLMDGPAPLGDAYFRADEFDPSQVTLTDETPFEYSGETAGRYFFFSNRLSPLLRGEALDPYHVAKPFSGLGYWNYCLEKIYASPQATAAHVMDEEVFAKALGRRPDGPRPGKGVFLVLADPQGLRGGRIAKLIAATDTAPEAIALADKLGDLLTIRFVVGKAVYCFLNR
ncbi:MAG TPA: hypothetical protein PKW95_07870 [bacterium]|nr:hypothetical protein [bacterium]